MTKRREYMPQNQMLQEFKKYTGKPNPNRNKRALVKQSNPHHFIFGNTRPIWKSWLTYAQNMELIQPNYEEEK